MDADKIVIDGVSKYYRKGVGETQLHALSKVDLTIRDGEFFCILGPSGCGKSTLLHVMAGFEKATSGKVLIDGEEVLKPNSKYVTVFQEYGLFPWLTALENVKFGLEMKGVEKHKQDLIALAYLSLVHLEDFADRHPSELSGGMKQRVAIARTLAVDPEIVFMDEPFNALDEITRIKLQNEMMRIRQERHLTVIFVTHDVGEALFLADRIAVMSPLPGKICSLVDIDLERPRDRVSSDFLKLKDRILKQIIDAYL